MRVEFIVALEVMGPGSKSSYYIFSTTNRKKVVTATTKHVMLSALCFYLAAVIITVITSKIDLKKLIAKTNTKVFKAFEFRSSQQKSFKAKL